MSVKPHELLLDWYDRARRELPWRGERDPYRIWLSEVMLQQTRVETVKGYYARFLALFPDVRALADAPEERVLKAWEGLGYYSRARSLHSAARTVAYELDGRFPRTREELLLLPGVGEYTAGAVASIAFGQRVPAVDGNTRRVLSRFYGMREDADRPEVKRRLAALAAGFLPEDRPGDCNQALMELGATLCSPAAPDCGACPLREACDAREAGDQALIPAHEKKRPPKTVALTVCIVERDGRALVVRRRERMLGGLYVFALAEETEPSRALAALADMGLACEPPLAPLGHARHVFTHRVWEMEICLARLAREPDARALEALDARWADARELRALPMPAAMRAARELALRALEGR